MLSGLSDEDKEAYYSLGMAAGFAASAHINQRRKYTGEPYVAHCIEVAEILGKHNNYLPALCAAMLHDVLEDTPTTVDQLKELFGPDIVKLVLEVTDVSKPEDGNRKARKILDRAHLAKSSHHGASIKLADLISNTKSIVKNDPGFAKLYLAEKEEDLKVLTHGNVTLWQFASNQLEQAKKELENVQQHSKTGS